jgi:hypothetical protein
MREHKFTLDRLVKSANGVRHLKINAKDIAGLIDDPDIDVVAGLWTDIAEPGGVAIALLKGCDLLEACNAEGRSRWLSTAAVWLSNEGHLASLRDDITKLVERATGVRGEFVPIADDLAFELVPDSGDIDELFVTKGGLRIARRGEPGTREAKRWIALIPGYTVRDITANKIEVCFADVVRAHIADPTFAH